ncbi:hypothetical protein GCM10028857_19090 [Salinarchaeum chitinilyticum]
MQSDYAKFAIEGNPVLAFWTVACFSYLYYSNSWFGYGIGIFLAAVASSITYYELEQLIDQIENASRRSSVGRNSGNSPREQAKDMFKNVVFNGGLPSGGIWMAANGLLGLIGLGFLIHLLLQGVNNIIPLFLFVIPVIWLTSIVWRAFRKFHDQE